ncbi:hypothetical protein U9M48_014982 [Paspalum notatum var. saurae]|uniref:B box-type domain-containing protein n=1 Tax=Paspalum notatum var. saurae TaxID=547442 RepID=A0AAQ3T395_PASNO
MTLAAGAARRWDADDLRCVRERAGRALLRGRRGGALPALRREAFFYCEIDGTSLCLSCDMTVHVGGKRSHGRYLLLRQRVEFPGDKTGNMDDVAMQSKDPENERDQVSKEHMANNHNAADDPISDGNCNDQGNIDSKMIDLNMQPARTYGQGSNSQTQVVDLSVNNHDSPGVVPTSNYERDANK